MPEPPGWAERHERFYSGALGRRVLELEVDLLLRELPEEGSVASVGCGLGLHEAMLARRRPGLALLAVDNDPTMIKGAPSGLPTALADASALPLGDGSLAGVMFVTSLEFADEPDAWLVEAVRVLGPGGVVVVEALNPASPWGRERLGGRRPPWRTAGELAATLGRCSGGVTGSRVALEVHGDTVRLEATPDSAALLVAWAERA